MIKLYKIWKFRFTDNFKIVFVLNWNETQHVFRQSAEELIDGEGKNAVCQSRLFLATSFWYLSKLKYKVKDKTRQAI